MNTKTPRILGVIPARGGSKGIPKKNIRLMNGEPLISYTIKAAQGCRQLDHVIVSTDSEEIASVVRRYDGEVPFLRPAEFAQDDTPDKPVLLHAVQWLQKNQNYLPDAVVILRPTTPLKTPEIIAGVIQRLFELGSDSVRSVTQVEGVYHPYWMYRQDPETHQVKPVCEESRNFLNKPRQFLPPIYRLNGVADVIRTETLLHKDYLYGDDMRLFEVPEQYSIDIDNEIEFQLCEILLTRGKAK